MTNQQPLHLLINGGARSGKSRFAEEVAAKLEQPVVYIATARAQDEEMTERIALHRKRRPASWRTVEAPLDPGSVISGSEPGTTLLLDCITLFLSNLCFEKYPDLPWGEAEIHISRDLADLAAIVQNCPCHIIMVTNELGWGIVPENEWARRFRDVAGLANQLLAKACNSVYLVSCGIPLKLKGEWDV